jgi:hypothetical protein
MVQIRCHGRDHRSVQTSCSLLILCNASFSCEFGDNTIYLGTKGSGAQRQQGDLARAEYPERGPQKPVRGWCRAGSVAVAAEPPHHRCAPAGSGGGTARSGAERVPEICRSTPGRANRGPMGWWASSKTCSVGSAPARACPGLGSGRRPSASAAWRRPPPATTNRSRRVRPPGAGCAARPADGSHVVQDSPAPR